MQFVVVFAGSRPGVKAVDVQLLWSRSGNLDTMHGLFFGFEEDTVEALAQVSLKYRPPGYISISK